MENQRMHNRLAMTIKQAMRGTGYRTQKLVSEATGVSRPNIGKILAAQHSPSLDTIKMIFDGLDIDPEMMEFIMANDDAPAPEKSDDAPAPEQPAESGDGDDEAPVPEQRDGWDRCSYCNGTECRNNACLEGKKTPVQAAAKSKKSAPANPFDIKF